MSLQQIDAKMLAKMFLAGAKNLENKKEITIMCRKKYGDLMARAQWMWDISTDF